MMPSSPRRPCRKCTGIFSRRVHADNHSRTCDFTDQIAVLVGADERQFLVHRKVICAKSKFFRAARSKRWLERKEKTIILPNVNPSTFQSCLIWVYSNLLNVEEVVIDDIYGDPDDFADDDRHVAKLVELYLLGDVLDDVRLRNKAMQTLVKHTKRSPRRYTVTRIWDKTPENSPLRKMMVSRTTSRTPREYFIESLTEYPEGFVQEVAALLIQIVPRKDKASFVAELSTFMEPVEKAD